MGAAVLGVVSAVLLVAVLRDSRPERTGGPPSLKAAGAEPGTRLGMWAHAATGIVNGGGGFVASVSVIALIGVTLDLMGGNGLDAFRWAFAVQYPIWALGAVQVLRYRGKTRLLQTTRAGA